MVWPASDTTQERREERSAPPDPASPTRGASRDAHLVAGGRRRLRRQQRRRARIPWIVAATGWMLAVAAVATAGLLASWWLPLHEEARDREAVEAAARELALGLTTFEGEQIEEWVQQTRELSTARYADEVAELFDEEFRAALRESEAVSRGQLEDLFVQDVDGDTARAFAVVRQTIVNRHLSEPVEDELRMEIALERVDEDWFVADVTVLPPAERQDRAPAPGPDLEDGDG